MIKSILTAAAFIAVAAPAAIAENTQEFEVAITYNTAALQTNSNVEQLKTSILKQARQACKYTRSGFRVRHIDTDCVNDIVNGSFARISQKHAQNLSADRVELAQLITDSAKTNG